jgi:hypothetical protein
MKMVFTAMTVLLPFMARADTETEPWTPLQFLVGTWQGDGMAKDASGKWVTTFDSKRVITFGWEIGHKVLVRRDRTEFFATPQHPAFTYEALTIIYKNPASNKIEAQYFDEGDRVIHFKLVPDLPSNSAQFVSDAASGPVFRLSYKLANQKDLSITSEVQLPGNDAFQTVAAGVVHKQ